MSENVKNNSEQDGVGCIGALVDVSQRTLDSKNRITISSGWRQLMGHPEYVYFVPGFKDDSVRCVDLLPPDVFDAYFTECKGLPANNEKKRYLEVICSAASQVMIDGQGRVRCPEKFLEFADLKGDVIMSGAFDRIKIWADDGSGSAGKIDLPAFEEASEELQF